MRIGIFTECYLPTLNGVVVSIETFRKEMESRGHEYFIFASETKGFVDKDKSHIFRYPAFRWPGQTYYPVALPTILSRKRLEEIRALKLDIIHSQHLFTMGRLGLKAARQLNIPIVYTYHTLIAEYTHNIPFIHDVARRLMVKFMINLSRSYCNRCDQIVTPSPSMKKILERYGVNKPIEVIPTGIQLDELQNPLPAKFIRAKWQIPEHQRILLYVSRISKEKNIDFLLKAMRMLVEKRRKNEKVDVHLLMVGGGPELEYYKKMTEKMHIDTYVTFTDMIPKEVVNRYFGVADIFVFPSTTETQGIVVSEAMAAGVPVVAIDKMGPSDLIKNKYDGYLTDLNLHDFTGRIEKILDDDNLRRTMSKNARINAKEYTSEICASKLEKIYAETINRYHPKPGIV